MVLDTSMIVKWFSEEKYTDKGSEDQEKDRFFSFR